MVSARDEEERISSPIDIVSCGMLLVDRGRKKGRQGKRADAHLSAS